MYFNQDYSGRILREVEGQNVPHVGRSFAEFKWSFEQLEEDDDSQCNRDYERVEATGNELVRAVDALRATIPLKSLSAKKQ